MTHGSRINHSLYAKHGFLLGVALFAIGAGGEIVGRAVLGDLPGWGNMLLFDAEIVGILLGLLAPLVFGIVLPLTE